MDYKVTDTQLTSIANAIRSKGGTSESLEFPTDFVDAIGNILSPSGNINITDMQSTDVAAFATAQVVDADLIAGNIKKDVNRLGIVGTFEGSGGGGSQLSPIYEGLSYGGISGGNFNGSATKNNYIYLFEVEANTGYCVAKPYANASHFRAAFFGNATMNDFQNGIDSPSSGTLLSGTSVHNYNNPYATSETYSPSSNGIIAIETSDNGTNPYAVCVALKRPS